MDTQEFRQIFNLFNKDIYYEHSLSFNEELNRQCNFILVPLSLIAIFSWLPFIQLDLHLYRDIPSILYLRLGFTICGLSVLVLRTIPYFKNKGYFLVSIIVGYLELATAGILGLVSADPVYMGGYAMLVLILPIIPFQRKHLIFILFSSLFLFTFIGLAKSMTFDTWYRQYGLYNLIGSSMVSLIAIFLLDNIRRASFDKSDLIHSANEQLRKSALEIANMNEELKNADKLKGKLLEIAAHDLKSPLQVIIGYTDLLKDKLIDDLYSCERLNLIYKSSDNMIQLINKLLKALTIDSGKLQLYRADVDLGQLAESIIRDHQPNVERKQQTVIFNSDHNCIVNGDALMLREILDNLLSNAIKFSPFGKSIWVTVDKYDLQVICKIKDQGPGVNDDDKKKMFARFQKLSATPTGDESSTGLGLAITKDLVELHNGSIKVESEGGGGSTFVVELPTRDSLAWSKSSGL